MWRSLLPRLLLLVSVTSAALDASTLLRALEIGDFDALNTLLADLSFPLPDQTITKDVAGASLTLDLSSLVCSGLNLGDAQISYQEQTSTLDITLNLIQADLTCQARYDYSYLFFTGAGTATLTTQDNALTLNLSLTAGDAESIMENAPTVSLVGCDATVNIANMQLDGDGTGVLGELVNALDFALKDLIAEEIKTFMCQEVSTLENGLQSGLDNLHDILNIDTSMPSDPLAAEAALDPKVDWLDFLNPTSWIENAVNTTFAQVKDLLVNNLDVVWNELLDEDGSLNLNIASMGALDQTISSILGDFTFRLKSTRIWGLDALNITNLTAIGASTLAAQMSVPSLRGELDCEIEMKAGDKTYTEDAVVSIQLDAISVQVAALVAVDEGQLSEVTMGSLLLGRWECLLGAIKQLEITQLLLEVTAQKPTVTGIESPGLERIAQDAVQQLFDTYGSVLNTALPQWIQAAILDLVDLEQLTTETNNCTEMEQVGGSEFVDFRDLLLPANVSLEYGGSGTRPYGSIVSLAKDYVSELISSESSLSTLMEMVLAPLNGMANASSGGLVWEKPLVDYSGNIDIGGLQANIVLKVDQLIVENLASLSQLMVLEPIRGEAYSFNNSVNLAFPPSAPLRVSAHVVLQIKTSTENAETVSNEMIVSVEMHSIQLAATVLAKMMTSRIMEFPVLDMLNWHCWLSTIPAPALDAQGRRVPDSEATLSFMDVGFSALSMNFTVDCLNCSSPKFEELSALLSTPETDERAAESAQNVIDFLLFLVEGDSSLVQTEIDRMLVEAPKLCPHRAEYDPNATLTQYEAAEADEYSNVSATYLVTLIIAMAAVAVAVFIICLVVKCIVSRRHRKWLATLPNERICAIYANQKGQKEHELAIDMASASLIRSKELPLFVRWFVPVVILGNIALFLSGHLSTGGEVRIYLQIGGQEVVVRDFYSFSIAQSGIELWNAGAKPLALLMLLFSGVWPYTKQLMTLALWVMPTRFVSIPRRGSILLWLDALTKWSMIDVFVMIVTIVAFQVEISSPEKPFLPADFYQVNLLVVPLWGLYANMLAQLVSQIASHFIIHYHRVAATAAARDVENKNRLGTSRGASNDQNVEIGLDKEDVAVDFSWSNCSNTMDDSTKDESTSPRPALYKHAFTRPHRGESEVLHVRRWVNIGFLLLCMATVILLIVGCALPSYGVDYLGLVGVAVESGMDFREAQKYLSVISTAQVLMDQARFLGTTKDFIGMLSVAIVLIMTALIVPIAQVFTLAVEWCVPLRRGVSNKLRVAIEIFLAWQYVEVFLLSVIVAVWQIGDVSTFMVNDYCGNLSGVFSFMVVNGILDPSDAQCFRAQASVDSASYILIAASVVLLLLTGFVSKATVQRARDEDLRQEKSFVGSSVSFCTSDDDADPPTEKISNVPVLFTDRFRWLLSANQ